MKVLHIINSLHTGGAEKLLVDSLPLYRRYGVDVDLLLLNDDNTPFLENLREKFKGQIFYTHVKSYYSPLQLLAIRNYINKNYDIIHCHLFPVIYWVAIVKAVFAPSQRLVFTEHSTENRRLNSQFFSKIDKVIYKFYNKITAITPQVKDVLTHKLHISDNKIEVVYNGVDIEKFQKATAYDKSEFFGLADKILIQVSRFQGVKDQKTLIRALNLLPNHYKLLLVGDGELRSECENLVDELNLQNRVKLLGIRMDIPQLLKTADIVIQSSHWEGFGLAAVEGMAAGKPTIVSNVDGLKDIVQYYGLLFEKGNEKDLASKILELEDTNYYKDVAKKCTIRATDFDILKMVEHNVKFYQLLLK